MGQTPHFHPLQQFVRDTARTLEGLTMSSCPVRQRLHFTVTLVSVDPPVLYDCVADPVGEGWCIRAKDESGKPLPEWFQRETETTLLRILNERASEN